MANRTNATAVKMILDTELGDPVVDAFITDANLLVTDVLGSDTTLSDDQKMSIEKWLAAHMIGCTRDQQAGREGVDEATITYQGKTEMGLDATFYGQQCKMLDTTGKLAASLGKSRVRFQAVTSFA